MKHCLTCTCPEEETIPKDLMFKINGKSFRCECGCNVFRQVKADICRYKCNSCGTKYIGE